MKNYTVSINGGNISSPTFDNLLDAHNFASSYILLFLSDPTKEFDPKETEHIRWLTALAMLTPPDMPDKKTALFAESLKEYMHICDEAKSPRIRIIAKKALDTPMP